MLGLAPISSKNTGFNLINQYFMYSIIHQYNILYSALMEHQGKKQRVFTMSALRKIKQKGKQIF
jgi:hypothetical protein